MKTLAERFQSKCGPKLANGCIEWQASGLKSGYGMIREAGAGSHRILAHRCSYILYKGPIPSGKIVMHVCDNPSCVNPDHLVLGTSKENTHDMISKNRHGWRIKTPWQKLTIKQAEIIHSLRRSGWTQQRIADLFNVSRPLISMITNGKIQYATGDFQ